MESTENEILMDEVAEDRPAEKKKSYLGIIIFLVMVTVIAGAVWYFQSTWMPHAKKTYQQAQTVIHGFMSPEKIDPMAAPAMSLVESSPEITVSAVIEDVKEKAELDSVISNIEIVEKDADTEVVALKNKETVIKEDKLTAEIHSEPLVTPVEEIVVVENDLNMDKVEPNILVEEPVATKESSVNLNVAKEPVTSISKQVFDAVKPDVKLTAARQAFWQRDLPKAEALYKEQINNSKANANSWGELGNIYYLQAKWQKAAFAYTEAALILLEKGDFPQAMFLRYVIIGLDPLQAKRIDERLRILQAPAQG